MYYHYADRRRHQERAEGREIPGFSRDIVSFGLVKEISASNGAVSVTMQLTGSPEAAQQIKTESERVLKGLPGVSHVHVEVKQQAGRRPAGGGKSLGESKQSSRHPAHRRRRQRQGRRGQIHLLGESRVRVARISARESVCWIATFTARAFR